MFGPLIEGDLVTWQLILEREGAAVDDILGFNLSTGRFLLIGTGTEFLQTLNFQSAGRVVFAEKPNRWAASGPKPAYLILWDSRTGERRVLETGLGGEALPSAFDGSWVLFRARGTTNRTDNGLWAINVDDGRKLHFYRPPLGPQTGQFPPETLTAETVSHGYVYYALTRENESLPDSGPVGHAFNTTIYDVNLTTGQSALFRFRADMHVNEIDATEQFVAWEEVTEEASNASILVADRTGGAIWAASVPEDKFAHAPRVGEDWVVYESGDVHRGIRAVHVPTRRNVELVPGLGEVAASGNFGTDGVRWVGNIDRDPGPPYESLGADLYWKELPHAG